MFIQKELGLKVSLHFQFIQRTFLSALHIASGLIESKQYTKILIVSSDRGTIGRNFNERKCCILGDAAAAIVLERLVIA